MPDRHITEEELRAVIERVDEKIDSAVAEVKKEVRWLLILGLAGSQLIRNVDLPASITTTGAIVAAAVFSGKVVLGYFFAR